LSEDKISIIQEEEIKMPKYDLVGVDGNVFSLIGYTGNALKREGLRDLIPEMQKKAMSSDYDNAIRTCMEYLDLANQAAGDEEE
jgi:hypothetical protein